MYRRISSYNKYGSSFGYSIPARVPEAIWKPKGAIDVDDSGTRTPGSNAPILNPDFRIGARATIVLYSAEVQFSDSAY